MIEAFIGGAVGGVITAFAIAKVIDMVRGGTKVPQAPHKGCDDVFVCPANEVGEISEVELKRVLEEPGRHILPLDRQPAPRKMAQIIKRKKVDPIDEILGNESDNPIL